MRATPAGEVMPALLPLLLGARWNLPVPPNPLPWSAPRTRAPRGAAPRTDRSGARSCGYLHGRMVPMLVDGREQPVQRRLARMRAAAEVDVLLEVVAELVDVAGDRHRGRVAERAEALAEDAVADVEQQVELVLGGVAVLDLVQDLRSE